MAPPDWKIMLLRLLQKTPWLAIPVLLVGGFIGYRYVEKDAVRKQDLDALELVVRSQNERIQKQAEAIAGLNGALSVLLQTRVSMGKSLSSTIGEINPRAADAVANATRLTEELGLVVKIAPPVIEFPASPMEGGRWDRQLRPADRVR